MTTLRGRYFENLLSVERENNNRSAITRRPGFLSRFTGVVLCRVSGSSSSLMRANTNRCCHHHHHHLLYYIFGKKANTNTSNRAFVCLVAVLTCALIALVSRAKETKRALNNIAVARYGGFRAKGSGSGKGGPLVFSSFSSSVVAEKIGLVSSEELRSWSTGRLQKTLDVLEKERREIEEQIRFASSD